MQSPSRTIAILGCTQVISWGALYYAFTILAPVIQLELGWSARIVFGAFSWSLLVAGIVSTPVGILLDRHGGRPMMGAGSVVCGFGLIALSQCHGVLAWFGAWTVLGLAMALTLYEAAFATINRKFGDQGRPSIARLTLIAGFSSTVFWPLTQWLNTEAGWRNTYLIYGLLELTVCLGLHLLLGKDPARARHPAVGARTGHTLREAVVHPAFWKLALAFAANSFIFSAMSIHLIPLLHRLGHPSVLVLLAASLIGPIQVIGRIGEMTLGRQASPQRVGTYTFATLPAALAVLWLFGSAAWAVALFCLLYGLSNGIITIVRGTIPQAMFGREHYGAISGAMAGPSLLAKAAGPLVVGVFLHDAATPAPVLIGLLVVALLSLMFYLGAVRAGTRGAELAREQANTPAA